MKRIYLILPLLLSAFLFSGCLNFLIKYVIHKDGSARVITQVEMDTSLLNALNSFANSPGIVSASGKKSKKKENVEQSLIDSVRDSMKKKQFKQLEGLQYVTKAGLTATPTDSSLIVTATIDLKSYRDIDSLSRHLTEIDSTNPNYGTAAMAASLPRPMLRDRGDSVEFNPTWDDQLSGSNDATKMAGSANDTSATANPGDSTAQQKIDMGKMLASLISLKLVVEVPNILSYDTNAIYDKKTSSATWSTEKMSEMKNPPAKLSGHLWFKKP